MNPKNDNPKKSVKEQKIEPPKSTEEHKKKEKPQKKSENQKKEQEKPKTDTVEFQKSISEPINIKTTESVKKPKKTLFALSTYNEYQQKHNNTKQESILQSMNSSSNLVAKLNISSETFKKFNSKKLINLLLSWDMNLNEEMVTFLLKLKTNKIGGISKVCKAMFVALKTYIKKFEFYNLRDMKDKIDRILQLISIISTPFGEKGEEIRVIGAIENSTRYIKNLLLNSVEKLKDKLNEKIKDFLCKKLDDFINAKIEASREAVAYYGSEIIKDGDVILLFGKSEMYRSCLKKAKEENKTFKIIFVDVSGKDMILNEKSFFSEENIEVYYTLINGVAGILPIVTKVFILARCMFSNGYLLGNNGASMISCLAHNYKKPVIAFCETFKFSEKSQMDSYLYNDIDLKNQSSEEGLNYLNMQYDLTPSNYIYMIICELGYLPTTSVPVVIREFGKGQEFIDLEKDLKYENLL